MTFVDFPNHVFSNNNDLSDSGETRPTILHEIIKFPSMSDNNNCLYFKYICLFPKSQFHQNLKLHFFLAKLGTNDKHD